MDSLPAKSRHDSNSDPTSFLLLLFNEILSEILSLLPIKTLMQMKCVCKSLKTLISDPAFVKLHLQRSSQNTHLALVPNWSTRPDQDMDCSFVPVPVSNFTEDPHITIHYRLKDMDCRCVVGSCNGLLCLLDYSYSADHRHTWIRFWNPATNKLSEKSGYLCYDRHNRVTEYFRFTFGYDITNDIYKVVAFSANKVKVFFLGGNVWRNIQSFPVVPFGLAPSKLNCHPFVNNGVNVSGTINWLAIRNKTEYERDDITIEQFVIVSLDLATKTYRQLLPPSGFVEVPPVEPSVTVLMDSLCFSHRFKETHFVLWKMMEFGVQESWTQFLKISFQDLQIDYGISDWYPYDWQLFLFPLCASESSNTLIMVSNRGRVKHRHQHAILYNWKDNKVEKSRYIKNKLWFSAKEYVESLVSTS